MLSVTEKPIMLSLAMLGVAMLNVVVPILQKYFPFLPQTP
jgi:hypothetical protein